jgi:hypothetical protein
VLTAACISSKMEPEITTGLFPCKLQKIVTWQVI